MSLAPGTKIGHYAVTSLLGEGGMDPVWQARDTKLNRQAALTVLPDLDLERSLVIIPVMQPCPAPLKEALCV